MTSCSSSSASTERSSADATWDIDRSVPDGRRPSCAKTRSTPDVLGRMFQCSK